MVLPRTTIRPGERLQAELRLDLTGEPEFVGALGMRAKVYGLSGTAPLITVTVDATVERVSKGDGKP